MKVLKIILIAGLLSMVNLAKAQIEYCELRGAVFEEKDKRLANFVVYIEDSEAFADFLVYEEDNKLYADSGGLWYFVEVRGIADFTVYFTKERSEAHFTIFFTDSPTFVGCD